MNEFPSTYKNDSEESTGLLFMRTYNKWHGEIKRRLKPVGITHPQFVVITSIGYISRGQSDVTQVMVANMAGMDVMSVSQILALLEKKGYVERKPHPQDTRANSISLTKEGQGRMIAALPVVEEVDELFFGSLAERETEFKKYLNELKKYKF